MFSYDGYFCNLGKLPFLYDDDLELKVTPESEGSDAIFRI